MEEVVEISEELLEYDADMGIYTAIDRIMMYSVVFLIIGFFIGAIYLLKEVL